MSLKKEMIVRIITDIILVNISFLMAFAIRLILFEANVFNINQLFSTELNDLNHSLLLFRNYAWLLTIISMAMFYTSGFYTYGRNYYSRYKALIIFQAVTFSYLTFSIVCFIIASMFPRSIWLFGYFITLIALETSRLWSSIWKKTINGETKIKTNEKKNEKSKVLVIGGAGFIGSVLVRKLLKYGHKVRVLDVLMYGDSSIYDLYDNPDFELIKGDFRNIDTIIKSMHGIDAVAHLGAIVGDPACEIDKDISFDINTMATRMIAEAAKGFGVRHFVFASTCSVYGASDVLITEKSMLNPVSMYAKTKIASEKVLLFLSDTNFRPIIMRFATIYGISYRPRFDLVINTLAAKAYFEKKISIFGGDQWRPFLHVDDVSEAIVKCLKLTQNNIDGQILNIGANDQNYQLKDIGRIVKEVIPDVEIITLDKDVDRRNYRVSFDKIRNILDFTNAKTIKDGINEIVKALNNGVLHENYTSDRFNNYRFLSNKNYLNQFRLTKLSKDMLEEESYEIL